MKKYINWLLIPAGILLVVYFSACLGLPRNRVDTANASRFFYNPYLKYSSDQLFDSLRYRRAYEQNEANWFGPYVRPRNTLVVWDTVVLTMLLVFGAAGFGVSLFVRATHIYCEWRDGDQVNWLWQAFLALVVPAAYVLAMVAIAILTPIS